MRPFLLLRLQTIPVGISLDLVLLRSIFPTPSMKKCMLT
jgi:hypothetical protein